LFKFFNVDDVGGEGCFVILAALFGAVILEVLIVLGLLDFLGLVEYVCHVELLLHFSTVLLPG
jgi:hypothetical protein